MWLFIIIYFIFSSSVYTLSYYYLYDQYYDHNNMPLWKQEVIIGITSILLGLFWPIFILFCINQYITKLKNK